jgi:hypothetical protein
LTISQIFKLLAAPWLFRIDRNNSGGISSTYSRIKSVIAKYRK